MGSKDVGCSWRWLLLHPTLFAYMSLSQMFQIEPWLQLGNSVLAPLRRQVQQFWGMRTLTTVLLIQV